MSQTTIYNNRVTNNIIPEGVSFYNSNKNYSNELPTNNNSYSSSREYEELPVETKTSDYTTSSTDFEKYIRFTNGDTITIHSPDSKDSGKTLFIANISGSTISISTSATFNGNSPTEVFNGARLLLIVVGEGEYDVFTE